MNDLTERPGGPGFDLRGMYPRELEWLMAALGRPSWHAGQLLRWMARPVRGWDELTNIPRELAESLEARGFYISAPVLGARTGRTADGTEKFLWRMADGEAVESVWMPYRHGNSVCVSTQAGCRMGCAFCASGIGGLHRDLGAGEMLAQVLFSAEAAGGSVGNIVMMGTGEPLDNYEQCVRFLRIIGDPGGMGMGMRHISLSTCGLADRIEQFARERLPVSLCVSLHAPDDALRSQFMPINKKFNIAALMQALRYYQSYGVCISPVGNGDGGTRRVYIEYALIRGLNDTDACARDLARLLRGLVCHVNLINLNGVAERPQFQPSRNARRFCDVLNACGQSATVRRRMGSDVDAACGQLRRRSVEAYE